jgi:hypothetical protein
MQEPIDRERVEITGVDLLLLLEDAGGETDRGKGEGLELARSLRRRFGGQGLRDGRFADEAGTCGTCSCLEKVAA